MDLEETSVLPGVGDDPLDINFDNPGVFEQEAPGGVSKDREITDYLSRA